MSWERLLETFGLIRGSYLATLAIGAVCGYLGLFCVLRRIVFTGVALAQLAAAGVAGSLFLAAWAPPLLAAWAEQHGATAGSLGASVLGALVLQRRAQGRLTSDALVGLVYSGAAAVAILLVWRSATGLAELQNILAGEVLLSRSGELSSLALGLSLVTAVHLLWRREFVLVSFDPEFARALGLPERRLQLLLLATLAVAVALSLKVGGLLLVFAFLVLPAVAGLDLGEGLTQATLIALGVSWTATLVGFLIAVAGDLPVAPSVTVGLLGLTGVARLGRLHPHAGRVARWGVALGAILAALAAPGVALLAGPRGGPAPSPGPTEPVPVAPGPSAGAPEPHPREGGPHPLPHADQAGAHLAQAIRDLEVGDAAQRLEAIRHLGASDDPHAIEPLLGALVDDDHDIRDAASLAVASLSGRPGGRQALRQLLAGDDPECRVCAAFAYVHLRDPSGIGALVTALGDPDVPLLLKEKALDHLRQLNGGQDYGFDPFGDPASNAEPLRAWQAWWAGARERLHWDPQAGAFRLEGAGAR